MATAHPYASRRQAARVLHEQPVGLAAPSPPPRRSCAPRSVFRGETRDLDASSFRPVCASSFAKRPSVYRGNSSGLLRASASSRSRLLRIFSHGTARSSRTHFRGERRDSNPRRPGPPPKAMRCIEVLFGSTARLSVSLSCLSCAHNRPRVGPRLRDRQDIGSRRGRRAQSSGRDARSSSRAGLSSRPVGTPSYQRSSGRLAPRRVLGGCSYSSTGAVSSNL